MDSSERYALDESIDRKGQTLARLLHKRITCVVRSRFPNARTIRLSYDPAGSTWRVIRVNTERNHAVWRGQGFDELSYAFNRTSDSSAAEQLHNDVNMYVNLGGARLYTVKRHTNEDRADYSLILHPNVN